MRVIMVFFHNSGFLGGGGGGGDVLAYGYFFRYKTGVPLIAN